MKKYILICFTIIALASCSKNISVAVMNSWVGRSKADVMTSFPSKTWGQPTTGAGNELIYTTSAKLDAVPSGKTTDNATGVTVPTPPTSQVNYVVEYHFILVNDIVNSWKIVYHK